VLPGPFSSPLSDFDGRWIPPPVIPHPAPPLFSSAFDVLLHVTLPCFPGHFKTLILGRPLQTQSSRSLVTLKPLPSPFLHPSPPILNILRSTFLPSSIPSSPQQPSSLSFFPFSSQSTGITPMLPTFFRPVGPSLQRCVPFFLPS